MMSKRTTGKNVKTERRAPQKSTFGSEKKVTCVIHRRPATMPMMQASNDTCRECKEIPILTVEVSEKVSPECIHIKVRTVNRIDFWHMKQVTRTQALQTLVRTLVSVARKTRCVIGSRVRRTTYRLVKKDMSKLLGAAKQV